MSEIRRFAIRYKTTALFSNSKSRVNERQETVDLLLPESKDVDEQIREGLQREELENNLPKMVVLGVRQWQAFVGSRATSANFDGLPIICSHSLEGVLVVCEPSIELDKYLRVQNRKAPRSKQPQAGAAKENLNDSRFLDFLEGKAPRRRREGKPQ